jgi:hypothetical protein
MDHFHLTGAYNTLFPRYGLKLGLLLAPEEWVCRGPKTEDDLIVVKCQLHGLVRLEVHRYPDSLRRKEFARNLLSEK